ncbi:MAG TPA: DUF3892 domain-containing protein [Longimicrobium sp.]|nr:DUF3892 domain-containing protein [Longimicrobium sp.]
MADVRLTCIRKSNPQSAHEHITHVGAADGAVWTRDQVVGWIDRREHTFHVTDAYNRRAEIGVVRETGKQPYLRTHADGQWNNNLLSLPQCS